MTGIDYDCAGCGVRHEGADGSEARPWPLIEFTGPEALLRMTPWERLLHSRSTAELCLIDNGTTVDCYLSGFLAIPVRGEEATLVYAPWVAVSENDYLDLVEHWEDPRHRGRYRGMLASRLPGIEDPLSIPVRITAPGMLPPEVVPDPDSGSVLVREGREGISRHEAELRVRSMLLEDTEP